MAKFNVQEFNMNEAQAFERGIITKIEEIKRSFDKIQASVDSCQDWWKGGSERAFIEHFSKTRAEMEA
ncbi:MAG: hypothetical protein FWD34_01245, partial [Oscillospiraceae bacterium]|nr:hypothetical protein [Oscillospiraceae bacterium]